MSVLRIYKKEQNFLILDKTCLNDKTLSWSAKGLHAYLMSLPDNWQVRVDDLQKRSRNGRDAVRAILKELEQAGYIKKTSCRIHENGQFNGIEYLVLEIPDLNPDSISPETEKPSPVNASIQKPEIPCPENPSPVNPLTEYPTLINNKIINNNFNNYPKTAAGVCQEQGLKADDRIAAVLSSKKQQEVKTKKAPIPVMSISDALIGKTLSQNQNERINLLVEKLDIANKSMLVNEIIYCVLSKKHFTACGQDFSKKLNAIRSVIMRGDWQPPAEMVIEGQRKSAMIASTFKQELQEAQAELVHFKRLLLNAKDPVKKGLQEIIKSTELKIIKFNQSIAQQFTVNSNA